LSLAGVLLLREASAIWPLFAEETELPEDALCATTVLPAMKPASAAPIISDFIDFVISTFLLYPVFCLRSNGVDPTLFTCEALSRISPAGEIFFGHDLFLHPHLGDGIGQDRRLTHKSPHATLLSARIPFIKESCTNVKNFSVCNIPCWQRELGHGIFPCAQAG